MDNEVKELLTKGDWCGLLTWANRALLGDKNLPEAWKIKGFSLAAMGVNSEAIQSLKKADELMDDPDVLTNLGVLLHNEKIFDQAEEYYKRAISLYPNVARMHSNLAELYMDLREYHRAAQAYHKALDLSPTDTSFIYNLGVCHWKDSKPYGALELFSRALQLQESARVRVNRGELYLDLGQLEFAKTDFDLVLTLEPGNISALIGLAKIKLYQRDYYGALELALQLEQTRPPNYLVVALLGDIYKNIGIYSSALKYYKLALDLNPNNIVLRNNLANVKLEMGEHLEAEEILKEVIGSNAEFLEAYSNLIYCIHLRSESLSEADFSIIRGYESSLAYSKSKTITESKIKSISKRGRKIKIGFVTGDFRCHPVGYFSEAVLAELNYRSYSLVGFSTSAIVDKQTEKIKSYLDGWNPIFGMDDQEACEKIKSYDIDILFDLSGHTSHNRLGIFYLRPAPVQITYLGYFGTTGLGAIDYIVASKKVIKREDFSDFTEFPLLLDVSHLVYRPPLLVPINPEPPLERNKFVTFGVFNRLSKINDKVLFVWAEILRQNRDSRIVFVGKGFNDIELTRDFIGRFELMGADYTQMKFLGHASINQYFDLFNEIDVCLDTFPFPGGTTTLDSLLMGVPVITKAGGSFIGRQGEMILDTLGLNNWIARDNSDYVSLSSILGNNVSLLKELRSTLRYRVMQSELYDSRKLGDELDFRLRNILGLTTGIGNGVGQ